MYGNNPPYATLVPSHFQPLGLPDMPSPGQYRVTVVTSEGTAYDNQGFQSIDDAWSAAQYFISTNAIADYTITVYDGSGAVAKTETVKSEAGGEQKPPVNEGEGGAGEAGGGAGQPADMGFRFRLVGWKWTWQEPKPHNPDDWTGSGSKVDLQSSGYTYGSAADALAAGKAVGDSNQLVLEVYAESNYPDQFAGLYYAYTGRDETAKNAAAKEKEAASAEFHAHHHWDPSKGEYVDDTDQFNPPPPPPPPGPGETDWSYIILFVGIAAITIALIAVLWKEVRK